VQQPLVDAAVQLPHAPKPRGRGGRGGSSAGELVAAEGSGEGRADRPERLLSLTLPGKNSSAAPSCGCTDRPEETRGGGGLVT
jgi:hypothetical protein